MAGPVAPAQFLYAEGLGVTSWSLHADDAERFSAWRQSEQILRAEVYDVGRLDVPRIDLGEADWFASAVDLRGLTSYMDVVRRSWVQIDVARVSPRADFVIQARRLMTSIAGVIQGLYPNPTAAMSKPPQLPGHEE